VRLTFEATDETVVNAPAKLPLPVNGGVMRLGGEVWTVVEVRKTDGLSTARNPVYRIFLSDEHSAGPTPPSTRH